MLKTIKYLNFRGFRSIELQGLSRISLLTGKNSSGKSSALEGIFLMMGNGAPETLEKIRALRGLLPATDITKLWEPLFYRLDASKMLEIEAQYDEHCLKLAYVRDDSFTISESKQNTYNSYITFTSPSVQEYALKYVFTVDDEKKTGHLFMNENKALAMEAKPAFSKTLGDSLQINCLLTKAINGPAINDAVLADLFGKLELAGKQQTIIEAIRIIDPSIVEIKTIAQNGMVQLYFRTESLMIPVKLSGDGMCKLLYLILMILQNRGGTILIDEIENGFHYSMQEAFWRILAEAARKSNVQIIATTHSYECIQHAVDGIEKADMLKEFSLHRLEHMGEESRAIRYDGELLKDAVLSEMEVR